MLRLILFRSTVIRGSPSASRFSAVPSLEPSSITITSRSTLRWARVRRTVSSANCDLSCVGMMTDTPSAIGRPPCGEQDVGGEDVVRMPTALLDRIQYRAESVEADVCWNESGAHERAREASAEFLLGGVEKRAGHERPRDGTSAVFDDDHV